jgi:hypothetical protein
VNMREKIADNTYEGHLPACEQYAVCETCDCAEIKLQTRITELEAALERIASASDYYGKEASDHDKFALAYAHQSTNRLARAALKGEKT